MGGLRQHLGLNWGDAQGPRAGGLFVYEEQTAKHLAGAAMFPASLGAGAPPRHLDKHTGRFQTDLPFAVSGVEGFASGHVNRVPPAPPTNEKRTAGQLSWARPKVLPRSLWCLPQPPRPCPQPQRAESCFPGALAGCLVVLRFFKVYILYFVGCMCVWQGAWPGQGGRRWPLSDIPKLGAGPLGLPPL